MTVLLRYESIRSWCEVVGSEAAQLMTESTAQTPVRARIIVAGRVQGVGYRAFCVRVATQRRLFGGVKNLEDGRVELEVEGKRDLILALIGDLKIGPPAARVTTVDVEWSEAAGRCQDFRVWY